VIKHASQLLVITFAFWGGVTGSLAPSVAFGGMLLALLGTEGLESFLAAAGGDGVDVTITSSDGADQDDTEAETDGGRTFSTERDR